MKATRWPTTTRATETTLSRQRSWKPARRAERAFSWFFMEYRAFGARHLPPSYARRPRDGASEGWRPSFLVRGGQRCVIRASRAGRATAPAISHRRHRGHRELHVLFSVSPAPSVAQCGSGSCQERASFLLDAGLAAMRATHIATWPSNNKEDGSPQLIPVSKGAMPEWSWQRGGQLGVRQPVPPIRSMLEQSRAG